MVTQRRMIEAQLISAEQIAAASEIVREAIEADAELIASPEESAIRFRTALSEAQLGDLLADLVRGGIRVTQFRELQTDLEEAFLSFSRPAEPSQPSSPIGAVAAVGGAAHG